MKKLSAVLLLILMMLCFAGCQKAAGPSSAPDEKKIIQDATKYFTQMRSGDFETIYNDLPDSVKKQTKSAQVIQGSWNEAVKEAGGLPDSSEPKVSCYPPENSDQIRVEFVIPCKNKDFKVFINYDSNGNLYNYVVWKNS